MYMQIYKYLTSVTYLTLKEADLGPQPTRHKQDLRSQSLPQICLELYAAINQIPIIRK